MTISTDLVLDARVKGEIQKAKSLNDVATILDVHALPVPVTTEAEWPAPVEMTDASLDAIEALPRVFNKVHPAAPKILSDEDLVSLYEEREVLRTAMEPLSGRDEVIKEIVRHHMDLVALQDNRAVPRDKVVNGNVVAEASPRDTAGHFILASKGNPERANIPGTGQAWSREYRQGAVSYAHAAEDLLALYEAGDITREQYLAMTREQRVFDETKVMEAVRKDPETYLPILKKVAVRTSDGTSMFVRKAK